MRLFELGSKLTTEGAQGKVRHAELHGTVTIGYATAAKLNRKYGQKTGRHFKAGDKIELGLLAYKDTSRLKTLITKFKINRKYRKSLFRSG